MSKDSTATFLENDRNLKSAEIAIILKMKPFQIVTMSSDKLKESMERHGYGVDTETLDYWPLDEVREQVSLPSSSDFADAEVEELRQKNIELESQIKILRQQLEESKKANKPEKDVLMIPTNNEESLSFLLEQRPPNRTNANHQWTYLSSLLLDEFEMDFKRRSNLGNLSQKHLWNVGLSYFLMVYFHSIKESWFQELLARPLSRETFITQVLLHFCGKAGIVDLSFLDDIINAAPIMKR